MPQLNPSPWLAILASSWLIFTTIVPPKVMSHKYPNEPSPQNAQAPKTSSWIWQWH